MTSASTREIIVQCSTVQTCTGTVVYCIINCTVGTTLPVQYLYLNFSGRRHAYLYKFCHIIPYKEKSNVFEIVVYQWNCLYQSRVGFTDTGTTVL